MRIARWFSAVKGWSPVRRLAGRAARTSLSGTTRAVERERQISTARAVRMGADGSLPPERPRLYSGSSLALWQLVRRGR